MSSRNQERKSLRVKMASRDVKVKDLAKQLGHDPSVICKAINHGRFPRVIAKIKEVLRG